MIHTLVIPTELEQKQNQNADTKIISTLSIHILIIIRIIDCVNFMFNNIMRI